MEHGADREEVVVLPQRIIQVLPAQLTSNPFGSAPASPTPTETDDHPGLLLELRIWQGISLILGLGWLFYYVLKREPSIPAPVSDAPSPSFELGTLKQACRSGDPKRALAQLRSWQQSRFEDARSLSGLIERFPVLAAPIQDLEQSLYGAARHRHGKAMHYLLQCSKWMRRPVNARHLQAHSLPT